VAVQDVAVQDVAVQDVAVQDVAVQDRVASRSSGSAVPSVNATPTTTFKHALRAVRPRLSEP
ncbi:MAG: hypothetical protein ACRDYX_09850, partial [Egibacteraceae bacterium]